MESANLAAAVHDLMNKGDFRKAEALLSRSREQAQRSGDTKSLDYILTELICLCRLSDPPDWSRAEALSREREATLRTGFSKLQTAMILYQGLEDYGRAVPQLEQTISLAKSEHDEQTAYTALSILGQTFLKLRNKLGAVTVLGEIERMVAGRGRFVVGDETSFLEALRSEGMEEDRVTQLASVLESACRDPAFQRRLAALGGRSKH